jgi:hypothetical protein
MRILRSTMYPSADAPPMIVVMRDRDLKGTIEDAIETTGVMPGAFIAYDVFDVIGDATIEQATEMAMERYQEMIDDEQNQALGYHWYGGALGRVTVGGVLSSTKPAPLSVSQLEYMLGQLAKHPNYKGQTVVTIAEDSKVVKMKNGRVLAECVCGA